MSKAGKNALKTCRIEMKAYHNSKRAKFVECVSRFRHFRELFLCGSVEKQKKICYNKTDIRKRRENKGEAQAMRTRTIKKEIIPYIVCCGLFALAGVLQYIDNEVTIFWDKLLSLVINMIFFLLIFIWGNSAKNRIVEKSTRRLLITVATLMFTKRQAAIYGICTISRNALCRRLRGLRQWG